MNILLSFFLGDRIDLHLIIPWESLAPHLRRPGIDINGHLHSHRPPAMLVVQNDVAEVIRAVIFRAILRVKAVVGMPRCSAPSAAASIVALDGCTDE
jgi:hypothetical protein